MDDFVDWEGPQKLQQGKMSPKTGHELFLQQTLRGQCQIFLSYYEV